MNRTPDLTSNWPCLTEDIPGVGGAIKRHKEDFFVEEIPLYEPEGRGDHTYLFIEKKGMTTMDAAVRLGRAVKVPHQQIGYAGLKDTHAVTRQWMSIEHLDPANVENLQIGNLKVLRVTRHGNKLKLGHLAGNRFVIKIREVDLKKTGGYKRAERIAAEIMEVLACRGVPNYFGPQRFGNRFDSHLLGGAILNENYDQFIDLLLGFPDSAADGSVEYVARSFYEQQNYEKAMNAWPRGYHAHRKALKCMIAAIERGRDDPKRLAFNYIDKGMKRLYVSAFQSDLFNRVLASRMPHVDRLQTGDLAWKHDNGACFRVENAAVEQPRCERFEISPSGPLFGYKMTLAEGLIGQTELDVLHQTGMSLEDFRSTATHKVKGSRRPLRFGPREISVDHGQDEHGDFLQLGFRLPPGCYATCLLRELTK